MLYSKFENKVIVKGVLTAVDPIHIGAGSKETLDPIQLDANVLKDGFGNPLIPGSSLKGVVRSRFEAIMYSLGRRVCDIFNEDDNRCISKDKADSIKKEKLSRKKEAQRLYEESCDVCRLFGGKKFAGKLHFKDSYYIGDQPCKYERRDGVAIDRKTGAAKRGAKYDFEIIPKGTKFDFELIAENLDPQQEKYFDFILQMLCGNGITNEDYISVGGKTTRGLGRVKLDNITIEKTDAEEMRKKLEDLLSSGIAVEEDDS